MREDSKMRTYKCNWMPCTIHLHTTWAHEHGHVGATNSCKIRISLSPEAKLRFQRSSQLLSCVAPVHSLGQAGCQCIGRTSAPVHCCATRLCGKPQRAKESWGHITFIRSRNASVEHLISTLTLAPQARGPLTCWLNRSTSALAIIWYLMFGLLLKC